MTVPLFIEGASSDRGFLAVRDGHHPALQAARARCEYLWIFFQHHADREFRTELSRAFDARLRGTLWAHFRRAA